MSTVPSDSNGPRNVSRFSADAISMRRLIETHDWSTSPLGPPSAWPQSLRTTVGLMLPAMAEIVLFWGADYIALYNDAYAPTIGEKHPRALGRPARENWAELWDDLEPLLRTVRETGETVFARDRPFHIERHGYPETVYFDISYSAVPDETGAVGGVLCIVSETTERVKSEQRVRDSEARFHDMADSIDQMIWSTQPDGYHDYYNRRWYEYTGVPEGSTDGEAWNGMFHPDDQERAWSVWRHCLATGEPYHIEYRLRHRSGQYRWVLGRAQPVRDETGEIARWYGTCTDIHDLKLAEEALRAAEERYRLALQATSDAVWDWDLTDNKVQWNEALTTAYGHRISDIEPTGAWWLTHIHPDDRSRVDAGIHEMIDGDGPLWSDAYRFRRADGSYAEVLDRGAVIRDAQGRAVRMIGAMFDLTALRRAEAAMRESEDRLRLSTEAAAIGTWDFYPLTGELNWDARCKAVFGLPADADIDYQVFLDGLHPDDREATDAAVRAALDPDGPGGYDVEYRTIGPVDGVERWISAKGRAIFVEGTAVRFIGTVIDISARKRAEARIAEQSRALETLNRVGTEVASELDLQRVVQLVTDAGVAVSGAQFGAFFYNVVDQAGESYMLYTISGVDRAEFEKFPMPRNTDVFAPTFGGEGTVRSDDITRDPRYGRNVPNRGMPEGHLPVRSYLAVPVVLRSGEVIGGLFFGHAEPGRFGEQHERLLEGIAGQAAIAMDNARLFQAARHLNETLEQRVAQALAERKVLADIVEGTDAFVQVVGTDWRWLAINRASADEFERIYGVRPKVGDDMRELLSNRPGHRSAVEAVWTRALRGEEFTETTEFGDPDLDRRAYEMKFNALRDAEGELIGAYQFVYDVTERLRDQARLLEAEEALRQSQKMETVGQLTGGIAHDFNNLLTVVIGNVDAARRHVGEQGEARVLRALGNALVGAERAATLTQRLLAFARRQPLNPRPIDPNKLVTNMSELLHRTLGETIGIETVLAAGLWRIEADHHQLENAILNLAVNARDAMPDGGKLTIETANMHLDRDYADKNAGALPGQYVSICVSDTGTGMDADTLARAFEPFFTTKEVGKGTGLGLSQVYGFVKQSGGHLKIYSEEDQGTTVRIYLPRLIGAEAEEEERIEQPVPEGTHDETILVCEDDDDVRAYTVEVLRELGYRVLEAHDGESALRLLERQEGRVDLLFTDVVLPGGMTGAVVAKEARAIRPDLRILFTTGYARNAIVHHGRLDPGVELITKPFAYADLAARIRDMLDRP